VLQDVPSHTQFTASEPFRKIESIYVSYVGKQKVIGTSCLPLTGAAITSYKSTSQI
jgi:hypothetical protein